MKHTITKVAAIRNSGGLVTGISFGLRVEEPQTGKFGEGNGVHYLDLPADMTVARMEETVVASREYTALSDQLKLPLYVALTAANSGSFNATLPQPVAPSETEVRQRWADSVDKTVEMISGQFTRFQMEYVEREAAAKAYIESGHTIDPTTWITRFADNNGMGYPETATLILQQADACRSALMALGELRMDKYLVLRAPSMHAAQAEYDRIITACFAIDKDLP
jgi:hypothetical protein